MKTVPVYFYYLNIQAIVRLRNDPSWNNNSFINSFSSMLEWLANLSLIERKYDFTRDEKIIWLESYQNLGHGNYNLIFKSAKYNHVRNVIDTEIMRNRGAIKQRFDGDEEKTHLCIRFSQNQDSFLGIHESNYYGMGIGKILYYLNDKLNSFAEISNAQLIFTLSKEIMPGDDFLSELRNMTKISLLKLTIEKEDFNDDFLCFAQRANIKDTVDLVIKKARKNIDIPKSLIRNYYNNMHEDNVIKRIVAEGANPSGPIRLDTELIKMKQSFKVNTVTITNEIDSNMFFEAVEDFLQNYNAR